MPGPVSVTVIPDLTPTGNRLQYIVHPLPSTQRLQLRHARRQGFSESGRYCRPDVLEGKFDIKQCEPPIGSLRVETAEYQGFALT